MLEAVLMTTTWPSGPPASLTNRLRRTFSFSLSSAPPMTMTGPGGGMASVEREGWFELTAASLDGGLLCRRDRSRRLRFQIPEQAAGQQLLTLVRGERRAALVLLSVHLDRDRRRAGLDLLADPREPPVLPDGSLTMDLIVDQHG